MSKTLLAMLVATMIGLMPAKAAAADYEVANVMDDVLYGAGLGGMVGMGVMLLSDKPKDNWNYVTKGVGYGIIAGAIFGIYRTSQSLATLEDGTIRLGVPTPAFAFQNTTEGLDVIVKTDLISGTF